ncbi:putative RNA-directed DNA polymerase from transposon BS [Amphibalanus amphitrite]|uniref:Putative RNA-directed DNA polymerase from transposon BS n=1 Tax=Amphibalanus amphitrite TaxID=1232801 RepID=A0A6A4WX16_AMPAM|nr:putative RNA-directed DNA polymerase from transposon BS [Amphibalanus amphitrite]
MIPPEQVGFREKRGVEDVVARLTQQVQDGWQLKPCPPSRRQVPDGEAAQKYVLVAYDFSRAYDRVDHRLLRARLAELGIPACFNTWVWAFLRDRRACVEVNGTKSGERVYRAGLPQGSVLSPTLFLLWSAPLVATLKTLPGTTPFMFADDTSTLCAGNSIAVARDRAQLAANTLVKWARRSKMEVAGQKTQLLVLSQNPRDAVDCHIHLGLQEQQLRAVANGYVRGAIEHAAAAWLPAVSKSNNEILEREMRAVARIRLKLVTGWRQVGREALRELRAELPVEALLPERPPPWTPTGKITFNLSIGALPAAGTLCSSFRAEMVALQVTLDHILEHQRDAPEPVIICTDSLSALAALREDELFAGLMESSPPPPPPPPLLASPLSPSASLPPLAASAPRRNSSLIWAHFVRWSDRAQCRYCGRMLQRGASGTTSSLWTHLSRIHGIERGGAPLAAHQLLS